MRSLLFAAAACLLSSAAAAQTLEGVGRISPSVGWRLTTNRSFYDRYYARPENAQKPRAGASVGGPVVAGAFAYAITESFELGVDLFATGERLALTGEPRLTTATYGALVAGRLQTLFEGLGPAGAVPSVGLLTGPTLVLTQAEGGPPEEVFTQAWGATAGVRVLLDATWAVGLDYRFVFVRGSAGAFGSVNGGGQWFTLGVTYAFPPEPDRRLGL